MRAAAAVGAASLLAACAGPQAGGVGSQTADAPRSVEHEPVTLAPKQRAAIERAVKETLKDPDSAKFGEIRAGKSRTGSINICGLVNAKNGFGGYTGMQAFMATLVESDQVKNIVFDEFGSTGIKLASIACGNIAPGMLARR